MKKKEILKENLLYLALHDTKYIRNFKLIYSPRNTELHLNSIIGNMRILQVNAAIKQSQNSIDKLINHK